MRVRNTAAGESGLRWRVSAFRHVDPEITWSILHLHSPKFLAAISETALEKWSLHNFLPAANVIWIDRKPARLETLTLRKEALEMLRRFREIQRGSAELGRQPSFVIGDCFDGQMHEPGPAAPGPRLPPGVSLRSRARKGF